MIRSAQRVIVLADSSKFGRRGFGRICSLSEVDVIITDRGISDSMAKRIELAGVELVIA
jgi:DeoR family transcriptional regulator of aga operon